MSTAIQIGVYTEWFDGEVDPDAAFAYARASNDPNDVYSRGAAVPPLFTTSIVLPAMAHVQRMAIPDGAIDGGGGGVHSGHQVYLHRPVQPGMGVKFRAKMHSARQTSAGTLTAVEIDVCDLDEQLLVRHHWANMLIGGVLNEGPVGPDLPGHSFPAEARGNHVDTYRVSVDADQGFRYAGASGDRAPHAISDEVAKSEGYPGKILQGMCTFALCSGGVVEVGAEGDPSRLVRLAGRLSRPCHPKTELRVDFFDAGRSPQGNQILVWEAVSDGVTVISHGLAEITA